MGIPAKTYSHSRTSPLIRLMTLISLRVGRAVSRRLHSQAEIHGNPSQNLFAFKNLTTDNTDDTDLTESGARCLPSAALAGRNSWESQPKPIRIQEPHH